ncbi:MAG: thioesterase family protein [Rhodospirillales bacterium]
MIPPYQATVLSDWIDYNGHLNVAYYVLLFDHALDDALAWFGLGGAYRRDEGCSVFVAEHHVVYDREVLLDAGVVVRSRMLEVGDRRLVAFQEMAVAGSDARPVATCETLCVHVDLGRRRSVPWPAAVRARLTAGLENETSNRSPRIGGGIRLDRSA